MIEQTFAVPTPRGSMPVHIKQPESGRDRGLVVLFMDAPGVRPALHDQARMLVEAGYRTAIPDLYYALPSDQRPRPERLSAGDGEEFARMAAAVSTLEDGPVMEDTEAMLETVHSGPDGWSCVGICAGGRFAMRAAARFGADLRAVALLHPSRLVTDEPDSPHRSLDGVRSAMYLAFGENDHVTPPSLVPPLRDALERHGIVNRIDLIPDVDHGFSMPGMPAYNESASEQAWRGTLALLNEQTRPAIS